jgi:hypothetical protein
MSEFSPVGQVRWCERGDSNPHGFPRQILSLVRLPIPPLSQGRRLIRIVTRKSCCDGLTTGFVMLTGWPVSRLGSRRKTLAKLSASMANRVGGKAFLCDAASRAGTSNKEQ